MTELNDEGSGATGNGRLAVSGMRTQVVRRTEIKAQRQRQDGRVEVKVKEEV